MLLDAWQPHGAIWLPFGPLAPVLPGLPLVPKSPMRVAGRGEPGRGSVSDRSGRHRFRIDARLTIASHGASSDAKPSPTKAPTRTSQHQSAGT